MFDGLHGGDVQGVTPLGAGNGMARYQVESGNYVFTAPWQ